MPAVEPPHDAMGLPPSPGIGATRRSRPIYRVFVSSTWLDLQPERRALMEALNRMEEMRFVGMEFFGNRPDDTHDASIDQVDLCEVFVGIIGHRYGSGITAAEYRRARALNLPCFIYFKRGEAGGAWQTDNDPALAAQLEAFKAELLRGHTVKEFDRPEELAANATADLHNWVAARWISLEREQPVVRPRSVAEDADRTNSLRLVERVDQDWVKGVLEASLHHRAWLELGLDWREDAVEHPWDRIVVAPDRPIQTLSKQDSITAVFDGAQHTLLVLGEPGAGKTTTVLELARDLIARARASAIEPVPVVLALSTWRGQHKDLTGWLVSELGLRYQVPKRVATHWLEEGRLVLILDGLDEVVPDRRAACVDAINAFAEAHPPAGLAVTCRVVEYNALTTKLRLRSAICLQPLTPEQIDRYFKAAGPCLEPLRQALRDDAGLRELARSPLMLSVMTMAWRDSPAGTTAPFAAARTPEELRRNLFDAYVQAALNRRGKTTNAFTPEQTTRWLTWLAQRMKENGHTLFALEQLQPGWLEGTWRQFSYYLGSRLLGTLGLVLPFLFFVKFREEQSVALALPALGLLAGCYLGLIDFGFARHGWGGHRRAALRLWSTLFGLMFLTFGWMGLSPDGGTAGAGTLYLFMVALAFCAPVDVRALDIKPAGSIQWSSRLANERAVACLGVMVVIMLVVRVLLMFDIAGDQGWSKSWAQVVGWPYLVGLAVGGVVAASRLPRFRPPGLEKSRLLTIGYVLGGGQLGGFIGGFFSPGDQTMQYNGMMMMGLFPVALFYVFGGFGSTLIDPARPQQAGPWFWLRVPVLAFLMVSGVVLLPGVPIVAVLGLSGKLGGMLAGATGFAVLGAGCGLVAFLRFGGFNGAQHFLLRWLLARGGHLPARADNFLRHAAQLALLQKVGLGYRFVHALLLQHLATPPDGKGSTGAAETAGTGNGAAVPRSQVARVLRGGAMLGLGAVGMLFAFLGLASLAVRLGADIPEASEGVAILMGSLFLSVALAIPVALLGGRWLGRLAGRWLLAGWLGLGAMLAYLTHDENAVVRPPALSVASVEFPGAEQSDAVFLRHSRASNRQPVTLRWDGVNFALDPDRRLSWRDFLKNRPTDIEANWGKLAPVRAWLTELNTFDRIADLSRDPDGIRAIDRQVWRPMLQNCMAFASLQANVGKGDAALATLQTLLEVGGKLEEGARGVRYWSDAREMQATAIKAAAFVLDTTTVSQESREHFAAALVARGGGAAGARRLYAIRFARMEQMADSFGRIMIGWNAQSYYFLRPPLDLLGPVFFNRQASLNRWSELFSDLAELAARRQTDQAQQRANAFLAEARSLRLKNVGHAWVVSVAQGSLGHTLVEEQRKYWQIEDRRTELLQRLKLPEVK